MDAKVHTITLLQSLTLETNTQKIFQLLSTETKTKKGDLFEEYVAFLYRGNGWLAEVKGGKDDGGADVL